MTYPQPQPWSRGRKIAVALIVGVCLCLVLAPLIIVGGTILYMQAKRSSQLNAGIVQLAGLAYAARSLRNPDGDYGQGSLVPMLLADSRLPQDMGIPGSPDHLRHAWDGIATVAGRGTAFDVGLEGIPGDVCIRLPTMNSHSQGYMALAINGQAVVLPAEIDATKRLCQFGNDGNRLILTYQ